MIKALPKTLIEAVKYSVLPLRKEKKDAKKLKEALFSYLNRIGDVQETVSVFWEEKYDEGIASWYLLQKQSEDRGVTLLLYIVITAALYTWVLLTL